jgi:hypothetical protein
VNLYVVFSSTKQWVGSVAHVANIKNAQNILVEKPEDKR